MKDDQVAALAESALRPLLGPLGLERVEVSHGRDHDDAESLFVTAYYRQGSIVPQGNILLESLGRLHKALVDAGEDRFPYLDHRFAEAGEFDDDADDGSSLQ